MKRISTRPRRSTRLQTLNSYKTCVTYVRISSIFEFHILPNERKRFFEYLFFNDRDMQTQRKVLVDFQCLTSCSAFTLPSQFSIVSRRRVKWKSWKRGRDRNFCRVEFSDRASREPVNGYDFQVCFFSPYYPILYSTGQTALISWI